MQELTVETMFSTKSHSLRTVISGEALGPRDRKRMLEHVIADAVHQILSESGSSPIGLTVSVTLGESTADVAPHLVVVATAPQYELGDDFFK